MHHPETLLPDGAEPGRLAAGSPSPRARRFRRPSWTDRRFVVGVVLTVGSLAGVVAVVAAADDTVPVWAARSDLAPGTTVTDDDVQLVQVQVPGSFYLEAGSSPVGLVVARRVDAGELLPAAAVAPSGAVADRRLVTVPVDRLNLPLDLRRGELVDVYVVRRDMTGDQAGPPRLVLPAASVDDVDDGGSRFAGTSAQTGVVLAVGADAVPDLVAASASGSLVLVRVPGA